MSTTNNLGSFTTINWYFRFLTFKKKKSTLLGRLLGILYQVIRRGVNLVYLISNSAGISVWCLTWVIKLKQKLQQFLKNDQHTFLCNNFLKMSAKLKIQVHFGRYYAKSQKLPKKGDTSNS